MRPDPYTKDPGTYLAAFVCLAGLALTALVAAVVEVIG